MSSIEEHKMAFTECLDDITEKIRAGLLLRRQKIIGFATSEASTNLFALFLHKKELISPGFDVNHKFFASSKRAKDTFQEVFENKDALLELLINQELFRDKLCYGKFKDEKTVREAVKNVFEIKELIEQMLEGQL